MLCVQALASVDIGSLICNVGAGGGAAPAAAVAAAPAGDAPGNTRIQTLHTCIMISFTLSTPLLFALQPRWKRRKRRRKKSLRSLMTTWASVFSTKAVFNKKN